MAHLDEVEIFNHALSNLQLTATAVKAKAAEVDAKAEAQASAMPTHAIRRKVDGEIMSARWIGAGWVRAGDQTAEIAYFSGSLTGEDVDLGGINSMPMADFSAEYERVD